MRPEKVRLSQDGGYRRQATCWRAAELAADSPMPLLASVMQELCTSTITPVASEKGNSKFEAADVYMYTAASKDT